MAKQSSEFFAAVRDVSGHVDDCEMLGIERGSPRAPQFTIAPAAIGRGQLTNSL
jgi:hypothetical protein